MPARGAGPQGLGGMVGAGLSMSVLRTDDARFAALPHFPCAPHYLQVGGMATTALRHFKLV